MKLILNNSFKGTVYSVLRDNFRTPALRQIRDEDFQDLVRNRFRENMWDNLDWKIGFRLNNQLNQTEIT